MKQFPHPEFDASVSPRTLVDLLRWRAERQPDDLIYRFLEDGESEGATLTFGQLDRQARAIGAWLESHHARGERALLLYPAGLDYIAAFFGCLYAGVTAIPAYPPRLNRPVPRIQSIVADSQASFALTTSTIHHNIEKRFEHAPNLGALRWLNTEEIPAGLEDNWRQPDISSDTLAFLQYTSGSTSEPKGVMLSHGNLLHNLEAIRRGFQIDSSGLGAFWLPIYHDMGLIGGVLEPMYIAAPSTLMSPIAFLQRPLRWLEAMSRYHATITGAPNFAYDLCADKATPEQVEALDLSGWNLAFCGAEPIRPETLERFARVFQRSGFRKRSFYPCFGMAEGTLLVSGGDGPAEPRTFALDKKSLERDLVVPALPEDPNSLTMVDCGRAVIDQRIVIANPTTLESCKADQVGEIWVAGPSVARGYWGLPKETRDTFQAHLAGTGEGPFLRTGDLGFLHDGDLYVTGRLKDLIIINGSNHYPQDIELTVESAHAALQPGSGAAFSIAEAGKERLVIVQEVTRQNRQPDVEGVSAAIRQAVAEKHDLQVFSIVLVKPMSIPKTSSGKIQRRACRNAFLEGSLEVVGQWNARSSPRIETSLEQAEQLGTPLRESAGMPRREFSMEAIRSWLITRIAAMLELDAATIDSRQPFTFYGLGSVQAVSITGDLEVFLGRRLSPTLSWDYPTIDLLANHLAGDGHEAKPLGFSLPAVQPSSNPTREPIAIVGLSCRFPGARDSKAFWDLLRNGVDAVSEVPADRWNINEFYSPDASAPGKVTSRWGGFLEGIDLFDPHFFGISPREAVRMDPQQRLLLEVSWEALENASIAPLSLAGSRTGVFVGISSYDYSHLQFDRPEQIDAYAGTGNAHSIAANRLSYYYDLRGPSMAVDTACSSSLVAVHLACQSLRAGESDLALAGGVNVILSPELAITFSQARMLSPEGRCKTFDAGADGYVRGEGCGVVVLKRLSDALRDRDPILALVRGSAVNQDGRSNGLTAPNGLAQQDVIGRALADAQVSPHQIGYVEAHGTGTPLGDPIEISSLQAVLEGGQADGRVLVGSVKTNIGHLEAAAGIAGLVKVVLALQHEAIPPHLHLREINPYLPMDGSRLEIGTYLRPWKRREQPRFAGVSSFGFGGTNAHLIVSDGPRTAIAAPSNPMERPRHLLALSARTESALKELARRALAQLEATPDAVQDLAFTANTGRSHFEHRLAVQAASIEELSNGLKAFVASEGNAVARAGHVRPGDRPKVAFLFTGQGSQFPGMGRSLYETQPVFRAALDRCAELLAPSLDRPLLTVLFPSDRDDPLIHQTIYTQPALFAFEYALAEMWQAWGIEPHAVMGHSVGEYVAACVAGAFSLEDGLRLIAERSRLMGTLPDNGSMAAVFGDAERVQEALKSYGDRVSIAALNGPENTVISGEKYSLNIVLDDLAHRGIASKPLTVSHAFHSPLMDPILDDFEAAARGMDFEPPRLALVSNVSGAVVASGQTLGPLYWRSHVRAPVRFSDGMKALAELGIQAYLEIGPSPVLLSMGQRCLPESKAGWLSSLRQGQDDWQVVLDGLGALYVQGAEIDWPGFDLRYSRHKVAFPNYPFQRERYWLERVPTRTLDAPIDSTAIPSAGLTLPDLREAAAELPSDSATRSNGGSPYAHSDRPEVQDDKAPQERGPGAAVLARSRLLAAGPLERMKLLEGIVRQRAAHILGMVSDHLAIDQPLDTLGFDSLMAMELKNSLESQLGVQIAVSTLLLGPTISGLTAELLEALNAPVIAASIPTGAVQETDEYPLTHNQQAMWLLDQLMPQGVSFNVSGAVRLLGELDNDALQRAFGALMSRHAVLRTTFHMADGTPKQMVHVQLPVPIEALDATLWTDEKLQTHLEEAAFRSFDLEHGPAFRVILFHRSPTETVGLVAVHHIITDFWSMTLLGSEVMALYAAQKNDVAAGLPALSVAYTDFVHWRNASLASSEGERLWQYWKKQLAGDLPVLNLPADRPRKPAQTFRGETLHLQIGADLTQALRGLAANGGATLYMALLAAFQALLHRYTGQPEILVGSAMAGRDHPDLAGVMGYFVNPVAMRADFSEELSFNALLDQVRRTVLDALDHQEYPPALIAQQLRIAHRDASRPPLFETTFIYEKAHIADARGLNSVALGIAGTRIEMGGLTLESMSLLRQPSQFDLTLMMAETGDGLSAAFIYNPDLFDASTVERLAGHFQNLLDGISSAPEALIATIPLLSASERTLWDQLNDTGADYPRDKCLHQLFEDQAERTPDSIAAMFRDEKWTYRQLNEYSDAVAAELEQLGVRPDTLVGLCIERSPEMLGALLGIHKAGGAYVPLDPTFPMDRLAFMLEDSCAPLLVTQASLTSLFPDYAGRILLLDRLMAPSSSASGAARPSARGSQARSRKHTSDNLAYVLYTSGSTGKPKGVMIQHSALVNFLTSMQKEPGLRPADTLLAVTTLSFDIAGLELYLPLVTGAKLAIADRETASDPILLMKEIDRWDVTVMQATPATWRMLIEAGWQGKSDLRMLCGGEALPTELAEQLLRRGRELWNLYGPTETTVWSTLYYVESSGDGPAGAGSIPIGRPIANTRVYVLDGEFQTVPVGVVGDLYISGEGLARGYLNRPELTAERFVPDPLGRETRVYKTGDLARLRSDGTLEFLGRTDQQVKIRGYRIETGEVEAALAQHASVRQAVVVARGNGSFDMRLVAYMVSTDGEEAAGAEELRAFLRQSLPEYMIPSAFVTLASFPLTPNGKVDRKALPSLSPVHLAGRAEFVAPRTPDEQAIAAICEEVLSLDRVGIHDDFFDLGGNSLVATRLIFQIQEHFHVKLPLVRLFEQPTVAGLAEAVAAARSSPSTAADSFGSITLDELKREVLLDEAIRANGLVQSDWGDPKHILLTGATGFLGAYLLEGLLNKTNATIYCIVRSEREHDGLQRIRKNLAYYQLWSDRFTERLVVIQGDLDGPRFGLSETHWDELAGELDVIYHNGAMVNFVYPYHALKAVNVEATRQVLRLGSTTKLKPVHFVSSLSVFMKGDLREDSVRYEDADLEQIGVPFGGYGQSKWVSEGLVRAAGQRGVPITIFRPDNILGDRRNGILNTNDMTYSLIRAVFKMGSVPDIEIMGGIVPVDFVSDAILYLSRRPESFGKTFHLSSARQANFVEVFEMISSMGVPLKKLPFPKWKADYYELARQYPEEAFHAFLPLIGQVGSYPLSLPRLDLTNTLAGLDGSPISCPTVDMALVETYVKHFVDAGLLSSAKEWSH